MVEDVLVAGIQLDSVTKRYGTTVVVDDVTLEIADREFLVLVGPSGCGKTTTLRMIAGLEEISSGTIRIGDRIVNDVQPRDRDIAMVFQNYALYPHMTVSENMSFGLRRHAVPADEIGRRIAKASELLGLSELLKRRPRELSGGQRQRVALGRAIVREPAVFLMDEPLSNLDAKLRVQTRTEILRLHRRLRNTIVYVTHDQAEAMTMADRIVVMKDGVVQQVAAPREIYDRPVNIFVAGFIGSPQMNFVDAEIERTEGALFARSPAYRMRVPPVVARAMNGAARVTLGVRPEDVRIAGLPNGDAAVRAVVDVVETLGSEQDVFLSLDGGGQLVARVPAAMAVRAGETIHATIDPERLHVFAAETGASLVRA